MSGQNKYINDIKDHINFFYGSEEEGKENYDNIIMYSAEYEEMLQKEIIVADGKEYPEGLIPQIIREGNKLLDLINFFTVGKDEVRS